MEDLLNINSEIIRPALKNLLQDKTTDKNIIWATDSYIGFGEEYGKTKPIKVECTAPICTDSTKEPPMA